MSIVKVVEVIASSPNSFEDAIKQAVERASKTIKNIKSVWVKDQEAIIENNQVKEFRVALKLTFILD